MKDRENLEDIDPKQESNNMRTQDVLCTIYSAKELITTSYSDQTVRFTVKTSQGD